MTLQSDRRGRIPFAFLGALLLVTSAIYAGASAPPTVSEPVAEGTIDEAQTEARLALGTAIRKAGREAAENPVIERDESDVGRLLSPDDTFRSYLRLRIALEARECLSGVEASHGSLTANVSLPSMRSRAEADAAMSNVSITPVSDDRYRVRFTGLTVDLRRHGRMTDEVRYNTSVTVAIPALRLHHRTQRFESRLDAGLTSPGFTRSLTARLFAVTWARGYAQYGGAPIDNVLANRHIEVMANDALLAQQAAVFGREDASARRATRRAATDVALRDGLRGAENGIQSAMAERRDDGSSEASEGGGPTVSLPSAFDGERSYSVDRSADEAFLEFVDGEADPDLHAVLDRIYRADVRATTSVSPRGTETTTAGMVPPNATLIGTTTGTDQYLADGSWSVSETGSTLRTFEGTVVEERVTTGFWASNVSLVTTRTTRRQEYEVSADVEYRYRAPEVDAGRCGGGCQFGDRARERLSRRSKSAILRPAGGIEALAVAAVEGSTGTDWRTVDLEPPEGARDEAYDATAEVRDAVRDISVSLRTRSIASSADPPSELADTVEGRRGSLVDAPGRYGSVTDVGRVAARRQYITHLSDSLRSQSALADRAQRALGDRLRTHGIPMAPPQTSGQSLDGIATEVVSEPGYLSLADRGEMPPPMAARNVNIFAVPYGDAADTVSATLGFDDRGTVSLRAAVQTLAAMEDTSDGTPHEEGDASALRQRVSASLADAKSRYESTLAGHVGRETARAAVSGAFARFDSVSERAIAITDGRMAAAIEAELSGTVPSRTRDRLSVELRVASASIREDSEVRVEESVVESVASDLHTGSSGVLNEGAKAAGSSAASSAWEKATGRQPAGLPAGLPLLPVPGYWYATANAWVVSVRGSYDHFAVRTAMASPARTANGTVEYVRTEADVRVDVDGDGRAERVGSNRPVGFTADTGVLVVVPPGRTGVGDVDGNADERSPGWE